MLKYVVAGFLGLELGLYYAAALATQFSLFATLPLLAPVVGMMLGVGLTKAFVTFNFPRVFLTRMLNQAGAWLRDYVYVFEKNSVLKEAQNTLVEQKEACAEFKKNASMLLEGYAEQKTILERIVAVENSLQAVQGDLRKGTWRVSVACQMLRNVRKAAPERATIKADILQVVQGIMQRYYACVEAKVMSDTTMEGYYKRAETYIEMYMAFHMPQHLEQYQQLLAVCRDEAKLVEVQYRPGLQDRHCGVLCYNPEVLRSRMNEKFFKGQDLLKDVFESFETVYRQYIDSKRALGFSVVVMENKTLHEYSRLMDWKVDAYPKVEGWSGNEKERYSFRKLRYTQEDAASLAKGQRCEIDLSTLTSALMEQFKTAAIWESPEDVRIAEYGIAEAQVQEWEAEKAAIRLAHQALTEQPPEGVSSQAWILACSTLVQRRLALTAKVTEKCEEKLEELRKTVIQKAETVIKKSEYEAVDNGLLEAVRKVQSRGERLLSDKYAYLAYQKAQLLKKVDALIAHTKISHFKDGADVLGEIQMLEKESEGILSKCAEIRVLIDAANEKHAHKEKLLARFYAVTVEAPAENDVDTLTYLLSENIFTLQEVVGIGLLRAFMNAKMNLVEILLQHCKDFVSQNQKIGLMSVLGAAMYPLHVLLLGMLLREFKSQIQQDPYVLLGLLSAGMSLQDYAKILDVCVQHNVDLNVKDAQFQCVSQTLLGQAVCGGNLSLVMLLLEYGVTVDEAILEEAAITVRDLEHTRDLQDANLLREAQIIFALLCEIYKKGGSLDSDGKEGPPEAPPAFLYATYAERADAGRTDAEEPPLKKHQPVMAFKASPVEQKCKQRRMLLETLLEKVMIFVKGLEREREVAVEAQVQTTYRYNYA